MKLPIKFSLNVISGHGRGKKMGIPTINGELLKKKKLPHGIYAGWVYMNAHKLPAAIHVGPRPVFDESDVSIEAHILETVVHLVPKTIELELEKKIRDVQKFATVDDMLSQIEKDVVEIKQFLDIEN